jgi:hypothetical protein
MPSDIQRCTVAQDARKPPMTCSQCGAQTGKTESLAWYAVPWFLLFGVLPRARSLCRDCAGGQNFLALLARSLP